ncbi:MAG: hypothetical protein ACRDDZ_05820 [Marinifilaceae bacterium]
MLRNQGNVLYKKLRYRTGELLSKRDMTVTGGGSGESKLALSHAIYERFLDMNRTVTTKSGKNRRKRGAKIHNRYIYGCFIATCNQLRVGLTEKVMEEIKNELNLEIHG